MPPLGWEGVKLGPPPRTNPSKSPPRDPPEVGGAEPTPGQAVKGKAGGGGVWGVNCFLIKGRKSLGRGVLPPLTP